MNACTQQPTKTFPGQDRHHSSRPMAPPSTPSARRPWSSLSPRATPFHSRSGSPRSVVQYWGPIFSSIIGSSLIYLTAGCSTTLPVHSLDVRRAGPQYQACIDHLEDPLKPSCYNFRTSSSNASPRKSVIKSATTSRPTDHRSMRERAAWMETNSRQQGLNLDAWKTWGSFGVPILHGHHPSMSSPNLMDPGDHAATTAALTPSLRTTDTRFPTYRILMPTSWGEQSSLS